MPGNESALQRNPGNTKPAPGSIVRVRGKTYRVGTDGDSLQEVT
jgi:hypothetical protein